MSKKAKLPLYPVGTVLFKYDVNRRRFMPYSLRDIPAPANFWGSGMLDPLAWTACQIVSDTGRASYDVMDVRPFDVASHRRGATYDLSHVDLSKAYKLKKSTLTTLASDNWHEGTYTADFNEVVQSCLRYYTHQFLRGNIRYWETELDPSLYSRIDQYLKSHSLAIATPEQQVELENILGEMETLGLFYWGKEKDDWEKKV